MNENFINISVGRPYFLRDGSIEFIIETFYNSRKYSRRFICQRQELFTSVFDLIFNEAKENIKVALKEVQL